jgi:hypothetical protein
MKKKKTISLRLEQSLHNQLKLYCILFEKKLGETINELIDNYIQKKKLEKESKKKFT